MIRISVLICTMALMLTTGAAQTRAADTKPTVAELKAAYIGHVVKLETLIGNPLTLKYLPGGETEVEITLPNNVIYRTGNWWITDDATVYRKIEGRDGTIERCSKQVKDGDLIYAVDDNGARLGKGIKIKK